MEYFLINSVQWSHSKIAPICKRRTEFDGQNKNFINICKQFLYSIYSDERLASPMIGKRCDKDGQAPWINKG